MNGRRVVAVLSVVLSIVATLGGGGIESAGGAPRGPSAVDPVQVALAHVSANRDAYGLASADVAALEVSDTVPALKGATVVYLQQRHRGLEVFNAISNVVVEADGSVLTVGSRFVRGMAKVAPAPTPRLRDVDAAAKAAAAVGLTAGALSPKGSAVGAEQARSLSGGGVSLDGIPVRLVYQPAADGTVGLAWDVQISTVDSQNIWQVRIDAASGVELDRNNLVTHENDGSTPTDSVAVGGGTYRVYDAPVEAPSFGGRTLVSDPANGAASPFGWHDTDGAAGPEYTITRGNNASAYTDTDNNNLPDAGSQPDGTAALAFDFPVDLTMAPSTYRPAAVTNLFYWNNLIHDTFYAYGFNEASGNFQVNNYGNGGLGNDAVNAEAQDGGGTNNANFATPPDGSAPRMQMYNWTLTSPARDGDFDNGIIVHEYGHGISTRLTGGPATSSCLSNNEQGGEGWSDWFGLMMTMNASDVSTMGRGIGTYALGQPTTGVGIRTYRYSTDLGINPHTYDSIKTAVVPHGVGSVWAAMLWEVTWGLIAEHGYSPDLIGGTAGNNIAMRLVVDGLKLQPCSPGFVDARNAILAADQANNSGVNQCILWEAFAKRGLGYSAIQGSTASTTDGTQAFDLPTACTALSLTKTAAPDPVPAGGQLTFTLTATNNGATPITGVQISDPLPSNTTYVGGSATCGGTLVAGSIEMSVGTLGAGASQACTFAVTVDSSPVPGVVFTDGFDSGSGNWSMSHGAGTLDFGLSTAAPNSPPNSMFAADPAGVSDQRVQTVAARAYTGGEVLAFSHSYNLETSYDGGVVEASTDGGATWGDIGGDAIQNGYTHTLSTCCGNPLGGRGAFSGTSGGYVQTVIDLGSLTGTTALLRFRFGSDTTVPADGWHIDDVEIAFAPKVVNAATASDLEGHTATASSTTPVSGAVLTVPGAPTDLVPTVTGPTSVSMAFNPPVDDGGSPINAYAVKCRSNTGGVKAQAFGSGSPIVVTGLSTGQTYRCRAWARNSVGVGPGSAGSSLFVPA